MKVYFSSIGVLTTYNIDLPDTLQKWVNMYVDAENNLSRLMLLRAKLLRSYRANLRFVSFVHKLIPEKRLEAYFRNFDLLHLNSASNFALKVMRASEQPKLFVLHQAPLPESLYKEMTAYVDAFIAPSEFTARNEASKIGFNPFVIHHGVNTKIFNTSLPVSAARKVLRIPLNAKVVLWNDRISPEKDLKTLLEAVPLIVKEEPNVYFYIKGRAVDKAYFKKMEGLLESVQEKNNNACCHIGWIPHAKLPVLYRAADIFVRTSLYENFGLAVIESMACGTPVVASTFATFPEILADSGTFYESQNSYDLAEKVAFLLNNPQKRKVLSEKALARVQAYFTWDIAAKKYCELYSKLAGSE